MTGTEIILALNGSGVLLLLAKSAYEIAKSKNGKEKSPVSITVENPSPASTSGKRICDFHMDLNDTLLNLKRDTEEIRKEAVEYKKITMELTTSNLNVHKKLDIVMQHFHISEWPRKA